MWFNTEELAGIGLPSPVSKILKTFYIKKDAHCFFAKKYNEELEGMSARSLPWSKR